jgi:hypothetical protein
MVGTGETSPNDFESESSALISTGPDTLDTDLRVLFWKRHKDVLKFNFKSIGGLKFVQIHSMVLYTYACI